MRVLLIDSSNRPRRSVAAGLRSLGHVVDTVGDAAEALRHARQHQYDVIVLDLTLRDGLSLLRKLREIPAPHGDAHILVLTPGESVDDRVAALRAGADDSLVKPFIFDELLARLEALTRRRHNVKTPFLAIADLQIDTAMKRAARRGREIDLSAREFELLHYMALRQGHVITRAEIEEHLYDDRAELMSNVIDAAIYTLRKKIDLPGRPSLIQTRRGVGYVLRPPTSAGGEE